MTWNDDGGDWQRLNHEFEQVRYQVIANLLKTHALNGAVLDVGCGMGILRQHVTTGSYTGLEPSSKAFALAVSNPSAEIIHSTAEAFDAKGRKWDAVVMSELLYYCDDPIAVLKKYCEALAAKGVFVLSIYQKRHSIKSWVRYWLGGRPSNRQYSKQIERFMADQGWTVLDHQLWLCWRFWVVSPSRL